MDLHTLRQRLYHYLPNSYKVFGMRALLAPGLRVSVARAILPRDFFVQSLPNAVVKSGLLEGVLGEARRYNRENERHLKKPFNDVVRVLQLRLLLEEVALLPKGDYAELGTYRGYSARIIFDHIAPATSLHCFDTFEGFAKRDTSAERRSTGYRVVDGAFGDTSLEAVRRYISAEEHASEATLYLHKGWFPDTFAGLEGRWWRFVHLDADLYEPMIRALELFYPRTVTGGVIVCHDYNNKYVGVKKAVDEFVEKTEGAAKVPLCDKGGSVVVRRLI
jgi:O-methyltransferase